MILPKEQYHYGGQAVIEGVMLRGKKQYAVAVRRADGQIILLRQPLAGYAREGSWLRWPLIRGNYALYESLSLGMKALQFSANVVMQEEQEQAQGTPEDANHQPDLVNRILMTLTMVLSVALGLGLFVLLPAWVIDLMPGAEGRSAVAKNIIEGGVRLIIIVAYMLTITLMSYVRRVFEYHGAEHTIINCYESGQPVTVSNCAKFSPLHPRCGTAFILLVIVIKIIVNSFIGWPDLWLRLLLRLAVLPPIAAISYEILRFAGRHRESILARMLSYPGMILQKLTTRQPDDQQIQTALYALAALAPEVALPSAWPAPREVDANLNPVAQEEEKDGLAGSL